MTTVLKVEKLTVAFDGLPAVTDATWSMRAQERLGLVGESGSGKTLAALAVMGLLPTTASVSGRALLQGRHELIAMTERRICAIRGSRLTYITQDPLSGLNPTKRVGSQIAEVVRRHTDLDRAGARRRALEVLEQVGIPDVANKARAWPHELSGGQRQRVLIARAIACRPALIIADEPTTALDVSVKTRVLDLLTRVVNEAGAALLLISHDLPAIANTCENVMIMYGGRIVERGPVSEVLANPRHPYTEGLIGAVPVIRRRGTAKGALTSIPGSVPPLGAFPAGCPFQDRCARADQQCAEMPALTSVAEPVAHDAACWHPLDPAGSQS